MPIEIRELRIKSNASPSEAMTRIVKTAMSGPAGVNAAMRGVIKLAETPEGAKLIRNITQKFTIFDEQGTPVRAHTAFSRAYPIKWGGPSEKHFNPHEYKLDRPMKWNNVKAKNFVEACLGIRGIRQISQVVELAETLLH